MPGYFNGAAGPSGVKMEFPAGAAMLNGGALYRAGSGGGVMYQTANLNANSLASPVRWGPHFLSHNVIPLLMHLLCI